MLLEGESLVNQFRGDSWEILGKLAAEVLFNIKCISNSYVTPCILVSHATLPYFHPFIVLQYSTTSTNGIVSMETSTTGKFAKILQHCLIIESFLELTFRLHCSNKLNYIRLSLHCMVPVAITIVVGLVVFGMLLSWYTVYTDKINETLLKLLCIV